MHQVFQEMHRTKTQTNFYVSQRLPNATTNEKNNWRIQIKQAQLVSQASTILLQRRIKFWAPLLKSLKFSSNFTPSLFRQIFNRIENHPKICLNFYKWAKRNLDFTPDLKTQCRLARILFGSGLSKHGKPILYSLIQDHPPAKIAPLLIQSRKCADFLNISPVLNSAIECFCDKQLYLQSLQVYQVATQHGVELTVDTCNKLLNLLVDKNELRIAWAFYASIIRNGVSGDQLTWSLIAIVLCKDGKFERVSKILDMGIYTPLMFDLMVECCSKRGDFESAFDYVSNMCSKGIEPTVSAYSSILDWACKHHDIQVCENVMCLMLEKGYLPRPVSSHYDLIIQKLCDLGKTYAVDLFFKRACNEKIELQHSTYECAFGALLCDEGRVEDAIKLFKIMQHEKILITESCYHKFVAILCKENLSHEVSQLLVDIIRGGFSSATTELSKYISRLCAVGGWREAEELLNSILDLGGLIDPATCCCFVKHYCSVRQLDPAILLQNKLVGLKGILDGATYNLFLTALLKEKRIEEAMKVFDYMKACKIVGSESFTIVITGLCHEKELRKDMKLHDEMLELGLKPDRKTYRSLISCF